MKNRYLEIISLLLITVLSAILYLYKLDKIPSGFYVDEAVVAYNAYSILETGRDAFGQPFPVLFRLLGSYTPPLFIYISALFIKLFGTGISTFRIISVISAIVSIYFFYLFIKRLEIYKDKKSYLLITFFYAISPWLVFNARLGYEVTLAYTLFNIGLYFLYLALDHPKNYVLSAIFFSLATYTAHTQRFLVPIVGIFYLILFRKNIFKKQNIKPLFTAIVATLLLQIPHLTVINTPAFWVKNQRLLEGSGRIIANITNQFFSYLSSKNLFFELNDIDAQHTIPGISVAYNWMVIPFWIGIFLLLLRIKEKNIKMVGLIFYTSLIPAVLSGEFISIQRALPFLLPLFIVIGLGIDKIVSKLPDIISYPGFFLIATYSLLMLYRSYFILFPVERSEGWNYGYKEVADFIKANTNKNFMLDNSRNPRNYILLMYYLNYPPEVYQNEVHNKYKVDYYRSLPPENSYKFGNVVVREINWEIDSYVEQIIIGDTLSVSETQKTDHYLEEFGRVNDLKKNTILTFYKTHPEKKMC